MAVEAGAIGKDARATTAKTPVHQGCCHGHNNSKDTSNKCNVTGNNQLAQQKDKRADKKSGVEDTP